MPVHLTVTQMARQLTTLITGNTSAHRRRATCPEMVIPAPFNSTSISFTARRRYRPLVPQPLLPQQPRLLYHHRHRRCHRRRCRCRCCRHHPPGCLPPLQLVIAVVLSASPTTLVVAIVIAVVIIIVIALRVIVVVVLVILLVGLHRVFQW